MFCAGLARNAARRAFARQMPRAAAVAARPVRAVSVMALRRLPSSATAAAAAGARRGAGAGGLGARRLLSDDAAVGEKVVVKVPGMGDSITDGGIVEWVRGPGDVVSVDEVIVVIETDKVNVDVRSEHAGRILETFGEEADTVGVGQDLLILELMDADEAAKLSGSSSSSSSSSEAPPAAADDAPAAKAAPAAAVPPPPPPTVAASSAASAPAQHRRPLIHFRHGKRDAIDAEMGADAAVALAPGSPARIGVDVVERPSARFARVPLSEEEIEAIVSGGAELWN